MKRRAFLAGLSGLLLPVEVDPERLNWRKGAKIINFGTPFIPEPAIVSGMVAVWQLKMIMQKHGWNYVSSVDIPVS